jgi:hypothetical protein
MVHPLIAAAETRVTREHDESAPLNYAWRVCLDGEPICWFATEDEAKLAYQGARAATVKPAQRIVVRESSAKRSTIPMRRLKYDDLATGDRVEIIYPTGGCRPGAVYEVVRFDDEHQLVYIRPTTDDWFVPSYEAVKFRTADGWARR